ncbi:MAG: alpha-L-rhamnosidase-related protein, partial [Chitinophagaceae bacterium]
GPMKWWSFTDWDIAFVNGVPDGAINGNSSVVTLQYAYTLQQASKVFAWFGKTNEAAHYNMLANELKESTYLQCFDPLKGEMANTPEKKTFSQHASIMGVLSGAVPTNQMKRVMENVLTDSSLSQATFYYRFYLTLALKKAGMANLYYSQLKPWRDMLKMGLTTFAERPDPTRSDCHAWSASPNYDFLATICGIMPGSPGFSSVIIAPALGELTQVRGSMPHPDGQIIVDLHRKGIDGIIAEITLPPKLAGKFEWKGKVVRLKSGTQRIIL